MADGDSALDRAVGRRRRDDPVGAPPTLTKMSPARTDGFPAVGRAPGIAGLYVAVMHSGITLAPAIGHFVAEEILHDLRDSLMKPYGLERFF